MLKLQSESKSNSLREYWTQRFAHLGDVISMLQWADYYQDSIPDKQVIVFGNHRCGCGDCGRSHLGERMREVLALMDTRLQWSLDGPAYARELKMPYVDKNVVYRKAKGLPTTKQDHVTIQLHPRGKLQLQWRSLSTLDIDNIMRCLSGHKIYNLGDQPLKGTIIAKGSVKEKLDLIAEARMHISVDSGTAHLAAMTDTPLIVISPIKYWNRYIMQSNALCFPSTEAAIPSIADMCLGKRSLKSLRMI